MKDRALRIFSKLAEPVDAILFVNEEDPMSDASFFYATGATSGLFEHCPVVLYPDGRVRIITSRLEETSARTTPAEVLPYSSPEERDDLLRESLKGVRRLGINGHGISYHWCRQVESTVPGIELVDVKKAVTEARMIKDGKEIEALREACRIASRVAEEIPDLLRIGMPEYEAGAEIAYRMQRMGASSVSFDTIAAFGPSSAEPHYEPGARQLAVGDPALFDFGCKFRRYCSDITRTFFAGRVDERFERIYSVVLESQRRAIAEVRPGVEGRAVDAAARSYIDSTEFRGALIHSTGHSLGLNVHDGGRLAANVDIVLEEGMVFTVEPGVYVPGVGGVRIEDDVLVTRNGCELLTSANKELRVI
ncbi:MAG: aminopeptidase P family protein [Methanomassiliicoccus sp.]|nr:aminopeptidase P family protein [Methanomassiliicoccus sp.]